MRPTLQEKTPLGTLFAKGCQDTTWQKSSTSSDNVLAKVKHCAAFVISLVIVVCTELSLSSIAQNLIPSLYDQPSLFVVVRILKIRL